MSNQRLGDRYANDLENNGITLIEGLYVTTGQFVHALKEAGEERTERQIRKLLSNTQLYAGGRPLLELGLERNQSTWTYNPFPLLLDSRFGDYPEPLDPKSFVMRGQDTYGYVAKLPDDVIEALYHAIDHPFINGEGHKVNLSRAFRRALEGGMESLDPREYTHDEIELVGSILSHVPEEMIPHLEHSRRYLLGHDRIGHGDSIRSQVDSLLGIDLEDVPDEWVRGTLDPDKLRESLV